MIDVTLEVKTSRDIGREILRHSFDFQEYSQRYAKAPPGFILREARMQDPKNRQSSLPCEDEELQTWWVMAQKSVVGLTHDLYLQALDRGLAKEVARAILPEGLTPTVMYVKGSLRTWLHYLQVRLDKATQKEHRHIAKLCALELVKVAPRIFTEENLNYEL